jgi:hypothetical protein
MILKNAFSSLKTFVAIKMQPEKHILLIFQVASMLAIQFSFDVYVTIQV